MKPHQKFLAARRAARQTPAPTVIVQNEAEIWLAAWCAITPAISQSSPEEATFWADECLDHYVDRFNTAGRILPKASADQPA